MRQAAGSFLIGTAVSLPQAACLVLEMSHPRDVFRSGSSTAIELAMELTTTPMRRLLCLLLLCLNLGAGLVVAQTGTAPAATAPPPKPTAVLIESVRVFDGKSERLSASWNVLVVGNTIQSISATPISPPADATLTRIAGGGRTQMPGLIDNHVHIVMTASTMAQMSDPSAKFEEIEARGAEEARQTLLRGVTTVRDLGGPVFGIKKAIDAGLAVGPRIYPSGAMISHTSGHGDSRLPHERSRRFFGKPSLGEEMGEAPAPKVLAGGSNRQPHAELALDELHDRTARPQRELHLQLLGPLVADGASHRRLLLGAEQPSVTSTATPSRWLDRRPAAGDEQVDRLAHRRVAQSRQSSDLHHRSTPQMQPHDLLAPLVQLLQLLKSSVFFVHDALTLPTPRSSNFMRPAQ
jgi:hypothetical protein